MSIHYSAIHFYFPEFFKDGVSDKKGLLARLGKNPDMGTGSVVFSCEPVIIEAIICPDWLDGFRSAKNSKRINPTAQLLENLDCIGILRYFQRELIRRDCLQKDLYAEQDCFSGSFRFYDYSCGELIIGNKKPTEVLLDLKEGVPSYFLTKPQLELREMAEWVRTDPGETSVPHVNGSNLPESLTRMKLIYGAVTKIRDLAIALES